MKPNSTGSVTPQTKAPIAAETPRPIAAFLFFAVRTLSLIHIFGTRLATRCDKRVQKTKG